MSFMPIPHVYEKILNWAYIFGGTEIYYYRGDIKYLRDDMQLAKPTFLCSVPRVFVKLYDKMKQRVAE